MVLGDAGAASASGIVTGSVPMRPKILLRAGALLAGVLTVAACGPAVQTTSQASDQAARFVVSGTCHREQALVRRALDRSDIRADVNGDGRLDRVAVAWDFGAAKPCRAFVGVRVKGGTTYSTHLIPQAAPIRGLRPEIVGLPRLGSGHRAEIVVDTKAAVDAQVAQLFTLAGGRLQAVAVPGYPDRAFIVEGGGVIYPRGAGCTVDRRVVLSSAEQTRDGKSYRVTRRTYEVRGEQLRLVTPVVERATVPVGLLLKRFPEFGGPHWTACGGTARLGSA